MISKEEKLKEKMKAWMIQAHGEPLEAISPCETEVPEPNPDEVRIRVDAAAIGLPDVFMCRGTYPFKPGAGYVRLSDVTGERPHRSNIPMVAFDAVCWTEVT